MLALADSPARDVEALCDRWVTRRAALTGQSTLLALVYVAKNVAVLVSLAGLGADAHAVADRYLRQRISQALDTLAPDVAQAIHTRALMGES